MEIRQTCPRRMNSWSPIFEKDENLDTWLSDNTCSFCGSLNPATFMDRLEKADVLLIPTDKSYKVYVRNENGELFKQTFRDCSSKGVKTARVLKNARTGFLGKLMKRNFISITYLKIK